MATFSAVVVGAGGISRAWFGPLAAEKVRVPAVVDLERSRAEKRIEEFSLDSAEASTDLAATLRKHRPDFVVDLTVPEAHCEVTCTSLREGCHVIGEKPMASSMAEARRMVRAADKAGKLYMVSQSRRWNPLHEQARRAVSAGKIGPVTSATCLFQLGCRFSGFRAEMESPLVLDMAIHHFDMARMITGADPVAVYCHEYNPPGSWSKGDIAASCVFEMTDGIVFTYVGSWCTEGMHTSWNGDWRVTGQKGTLELAGDQPPSAEVGTGAGKGGVQPSKPARLRPVSMKHGGMHGALREMLAYLRKGQMPQTECHDNIKSLAMVFAAIESSRKGRRVPVRAM